MGGRHVEGSMSSGCTLPSRTKQAPCVCMGAWLCLLAKAVKSAFCKSRGRVVGEWWRGSSASEGKLTGPELGLGILDPVE